MSKHLKYPCTPHSLGDTMMLMESLSHDMVLEDMEFSFFVFFFVFFLGINQFIYVYVCVCMTCFYV